MDAVNVMKQDDAMARNKLQQNSYDFLMYGKYNVETLNKVIDTDTHFINARLRLSLHLRLLRLGWSMMC